ncbi:MAG: hypothetical protein M3P06_10955 [Acidobacteriota bacterium]|nr:hypothetical protein [Acidobacteriota bacterium]
MFLAEIVLASRILGLVAGEQRVEVQADAAVRSIEVQRDGVTVAALHRPPWSAVVNFGLELAPHELTVVAFDQAGNELGRDTQAINVARPPAEFGILFDRDAEGQVTAAIRASHFAHRLPKNVTVKLDGRVIRKNRNLTTYSLGTVNLSTIHVLDVEVEFPDRIRSRKEVVFGGHAGFSEQVPSEMTPVAVRQRKAPGGATADCFRLGTQLLPPVTIERGDGTAHFILNGSRGVMKGNEAPEHRSDARFALPDVEIDIVNPVAEAIQLPGSLTRLFNSQSMSGKKGTRRALAMAVTPEGHTQIADAVGAAALRALRGGSRRVVVVVIGSAPAPDLSVHRPDFMRRYLERVGVPLRVWSLTGPRPDLAETWGEVKDVSTAALLLAATEDLRQELNAQRVAWMPVGTANAYRVIATSDCAYEPLAGVGLALKSSDSRLKSSDQRLTPSDRAASAR